jgi:xylan 1,4-beta-xylosidase
MAFDYALGGKRKTLKAGVDVTFLSTKPAGGFVGTVIGTYAWRRRPDHQVRQAP